MISNNYIPEKINDANAYLDGTRMIGVAASVDLPEVNMKTGTVEGFGVGGEIDSPTIGQWESFEQEVQFNTLYSSAVDMLNPLTVVNLTFRAAQQVYDKTGGYDFKGLRVVEMGRVKKFKPGKIEKSEGMEATVTLELTYIMIEVDGEQLIEIDKLNGVYKVKGVDKRGQHYDQRGRRHKQILLPGEPRKAAGDLGAAGERPRHDGVYTGRGEQQSRAVRPAALADTAGHAAGRMAVRSGYADRQPDEPAICEHLLKRA